MRGSQDSQSTCHIVKHIYIPITKQYKSNKQLSEKQIKKRLEKDGWEVWRGGYLQCTRYSELYPNVEKKYSRVPLLLGKALECLQYLSVVHHGMPDFFCHRKGIIKFVECKLGHEQLSKAQKKAIERIQELGIKVEVHKLVYGCTKIRTANVNLRNGEKKIIEKQERLKLRYPKKRDA
jgi:hypothetical protein